MSNSTPNIYVQFAENGNLQKWSMELFEGAQKVEVGKMLHSLAELRILQTKLCVPAVVSHIADKPFQDLGE